MEDVKAYDSNRPQQSAGLFVHSGRNIRPLLFNTVNINFASSLRIDHGHM